MAVCYIGSQRVFGSNFVGYLAWRGVFYALEASFWEMAAEASGGTLSGEYNIYNNKAEE